jgi:cellulose synthase/poly-beta-1,6-N-acetylglucosamine synthase-like glycosyltransferase
MIAAIIFWISVAAIFHSYVLFPAILALLSLRTQKKSPEPDAELPKVSILMAAYNEEAVIREKINSVTSGLYPADRLEILVGSDASSDATNDILKELASTIPNLRFYEFTTRQGKPGIINRLAQHASGEILVLTDANVLFNPDTLIEIVKPFTDPQMGLVDTRMVNLGMKKEGISYQEKAYISREVDIKTMESRLWGTMMGPFGGCFAIRRELFDPIPGTFLVDDFYLNMKVLEQGFKAVNHPEAIVFEDVSNDPKIEFRRKVRIATGNFQNLARFKKLLFSSRPGLSFSFWSHKVIRWLGPVFMLAALVSLAFLAIGSPFYLVLLAGYLLVLIVPGLDFLLKKLHLHFRFFRFVSYFLAMNLAMAKGLLRYLKGVQSNVWQPTKRHQ